MSAVYLLGTSATRFQRWPERTFRDLADEAVRAALGDAGLRAAAPVEQVWFGNCAMGSWGQGNIRGQVVLDPLQRAGVLPARVPIINVEAGCATGSAAFHGAFKDVASGGHLSLAVGVEKTFVPHDPAATLAVFDGGIDRLHPEEWEAFYADAGERGGVALTRHPQRVLFVDIHAMVARHHMARYGTTVEQIAAIAAKSHRHGSLNPKAQYQRALTAAEVLADRPVVEPLTRAMCAPVSDGAAAAVLCSEAFLARCSAQQRARALRVRASVLCGGTWRELDQASVVAEAGRRAYALAGMEPAHIGVAEVHDATSADELRHTEDLGFCRPGEGGAYGASGATGIGGERPINTSGGLVSKGHPLAATGLGMIDELALQLRDEAGPRQALARPHERAG